MPRNYFCPRCMDTGIVGILRRECPDCKGDPESAKRRILSQSPASPPAPPPRKPVFPPPGLPHFPYAKFREEQERKEILKSVRKLAASQKCPHCGKQINP